MVNNDPSPLIEGHIHVNIHGHIYIYMNFMQIRFKTWKCSSPTVENACRGKMAQWGRGTWSWYEDIKLENETDFRHIIIFIKVTQRKLWKKLWNKVSIKI